MKVCPQCQREYADHVKFCHRDGSPLEAIRTDKDPLLGRVIGGRYEVLGFLGGGGFGNVYKIKNIGLDEIEALKIIHPEHVREREHLDRFRREAKLLRKLGSKSAAIVDMYSMEEDRDEGFVYFTMEYVDGAPLTKTIIKEGALPVDRTIMLMRQLCAALEVAHAQGIIHRDLKLDNILLPSAEGEERVKILDFGIAKVLGQKSLSDISKGMPGTPGYAAPEQIKGEAEKIGATTDLFAAGVILYNMLTGCDPWKGESVGKSTSEGGDWEVVRKTLEENPVSPRKLNPSIPKDLDSIACKLLQKDQKRRFQTAAELDAALARVELSLQVAEPKVRRSISSRIPKKKIEELSRIPKKKIEELSSTLTDATKAAASTAKKWALPVGVVAGVAVIGYTTWRLLPERVPVAAVEVRPAQGAVTVTDTLLLLAMAKDSVGMTLFDRGVRWRSSDEQIATVDSEGRVVGVAPGLALITAASGGQSGTARIDVRPGTPPPEPDLAIRVVPEAETVQVGETVELLATDSLGSPLNQPIEWTSSAEQIARVDSRGVVSGESEGTASVTATSNGRSGEATITVIAAPPDTSRPVVARVQLGPSRVRLEVGATERLTARAVDAEGSRVDRPIRYRSSNPRVATVDGSGMITGRTPGTATITASSEGGVSATASVTVDPARIAQLELDPPAIRLLEGDTTSLRATAKDARGNPITGRQIDWITVDENVARFDRTSDTTARILGVTPGTTQIRVEGDNAEDESTVRVDPMERPEIDISNAGGGFSDGTLSFEVDLALSSLRGTACCAVTVIYKENGDPVLRDGNQVGTMQDFTPRSDSHRLLLTLAASELGFGARQIGDNDLLAGVSVWPRTCRGVDRNETPLATSQIPFCVRKTMTGYDRCN